MAFTLAAPLAACGDNRPASDFESLRRTARRALVELRAERPEAAAEVDLLLRKAEEVTAVEMNRRPARRDPLRVESAWAQVIEVAADRVIELRRHRAALEHRYVAVKSEVEREVASAKERMRQPGMGRREAMAMNRAETELANARRLAAEGDFERAVRSAERARVFAATPEATFRALMERFSDPKMLRQWRRWVEETLARSRRDGGPAIVVDKLGRRLILYRRGRVEAVYTAELGANGLRPKRHAGDRATPEGRYRVVVKKHGGATKYYKALLIDYPNPEDLKSYRAAREAGSVPRGAGVGSLIEIHGEGGAGRDWTDGCVALTNDDMDRLYPRITVGTPVTIVGTF